MLNPMSLVPVSVGDGVCADPHFHLGGPLVCHLLSSQVQIHHGKSQDCDSNHLVAFFAV